MYHLRNDTLKYYRSLPLFQKRECRLSTPQVVEVMNAFPSWNANMPAPEEDALRFYLLNHAFALLEQKFGQDEPMGEAAEIAQAYLKEAGEVFRRLYYYLLVICARESRHLHKSATLDKKVIELLGEVDAGIYKSFQTNIPDSASAAPQFFKANPPKISMIDFMRATELIFDKGSFSSSYGGPKWGMIARTLRQVVDGSTSPEMMLDTSWCLAHNTCSIFNKGMLYQNYSGDLQKVLDVQRSGQIPQFIGEFACTGNTARVKNLLAMCVKHFPKEMTGYVDWFQVEELGSVKKYPSEKNAQLAKYGASKYGQINEKRFYVTPSTYAVITERKKAA